MNINKIIEGQREKFEQTMEALFQWRYQYDAECEALDGNTGSFWGNEKVAKLRDDFLIQLAEGEIERLKGMKLEGGMDYKRWYNKALDESIAHWEQVLSELKK